MAKELGVEGNDNDRIEAKGSKIGELFSSRVEKMIRMYLHHVLGPGGAVDFLVLLAASNAVIFQSGKFARGRRGQEWAQIIERQIVACVR